MKLSSKYQPTTLDEVVGQPAAIRRLKTFVMEPFPCCILLEGKGGIGKSATAKALAADLDIPEYGGLYRYNGASLRIEDVDRLFSETFTLRPMFGSQWYMLLIEEMELLPSANVFSALKDQLSEQNHPERLIVVATSNNTAKLLEKDDSFMQRFEGYGFPFSCGPSFAEACLDRLGQIWEAETGGTAPMPAAVAMMGWKAVKEGGQAYSMRRALAALGAAVELHAADVAREEVAA